MMVDLVSDFLVLLSSCSSFLARIAFSGYLIWMAIEVSLMSLSFWLTSRPEIWNKGTWHVDFGLAILLGQSWDVEVNILHQAFPLGFQLPIKRINSQQQRIWHQGYRFKLELGFEDILRFRKLNIKRILGFGLLIIRIGLMLSQDWTEGWLWMRYKSTYHRHVLFWLNVIYIIGSFECCIFNYQSIIWNYYYCVICLQLYVNWVLSLPPIT